MFYNISGLGINLKYFRYESDDHPENLPAVDTIHFIKSVRKGARHRAKFYFVHNDKFVKGSQSIYDAYARNLGPLDILNFSLCVLFDPTNFSLNKFPLYPNSDAKNNLLILSTPSNLLISLFQIHRSSILY